MPSASEPRANRLIDSTSPYLLQHAHNPVDWYPWGEEALGRARAEDKPILLSIGYSACHWCHVMAHESFEDPSIGEAMSREFVCIKVDREERPDLDDIYMAATLAMNHGQGGWPMTVFLTPEQEPFFAGTYFPPEDRWGRPGFRTLLQRIADAWREDRAGIREQGARLAEHLRDNARAAPGAGVGEREILEAAAQLGHSYDPRHGGFGPAPKFPPATALSLLLRVHRRFGDARALEMVRGTLDAMARGGIYDQLGGGFHRYSVDAEWLVPHFEKMLYDNALLARIYLDAWTATAEPFYRRVATETLDYVLREMTDPEGGFYSATDADSEGEEGRFFVWTPEQIAEALGDAEAARRFCAHYDVTAEGNWEGRSILRTLRPLAQVAADAGVGATELERELDASKARLYAERRKRVPPGLDDKVLTAWNALMLGALAEGARVLGEPRYLEAARRNAAFLLRALRRPDGGLLRTWRAGHAHLDAYLEDYAYLAGALVDLYEASGERAHLDAALETAERLRRDFAAGEGGWFSVAASHERLLVRHREGHDGAIPNASASAAQALARIGFHLGRDDLREDATRALRAWGRAIERQPRAFCRSLEVADLLMEEPVELALVGEAGDPGLVALQRELGRHYLPNRVVALGAPGDPHPLLEGRALVEGRAALYVCRDRVCRRPVTEPAEVGGALRDQQDAAPPAPRALSLPRLRGGATAQGTAARAARHRGAHPHGDTALGTTGLTCSRLGFGCYRVDDESPEHREALVSALRGGVNLIDTASSYGLGASERLVGEVIADLARRADGPRREELILVSKLGFVQGAALERTRQREADGAAPIAATRISETAWHSLDPRFLADELEQSLERLRVERLDVLLLHNPEIALGEAAGGTPAERRRDLDGRLGEAFAWLEEQAAAERVGCYGISSNAVAARPDDPGGLPLEAVLAAARRAGGEGHRMRVLQLPLNLAEGAAALRRCCGEDRAQTPLEWARAHGLAVLVNRPLNAMRDGDLIRLAEVGPGAEPAYLDVALDALAALEQEFREGLARSLQTGPGLPDPDDLFRWSEELRELEPRLTGHPQWKELEVSRVYPRLMRTLAALDRALRGDHAERGRSWRERYLLPLETALGEIDRRARERSRARTAPLAGALRERLPEARRAEGLSRLALWPLLSTPGVSSVLVGMREPAYVADALGVLGWAPLEHPLSAYEPLPA